MNEADAQAFKCLLDKVGAYYEQVISNPDVWWQALGPYALDPVEKAFKAWMGSDKGDYPPKPINILRLVMSLTVEQDNRLGPEEAWSIALQSMDEAVTVVWTQEIATAYGVAKPVLEAGDEVGARMAFREVYAKEVVRARAEGRPVKWLKSLGHDETMRAPALEDAAARLDLPQLREAARLEYERHQGPAENLRERIAEIKLHLTTAVSQPVERNRIQRMLEELPQDREERKRAIEAMDGTTRHKVKHILGELERTRQLALAEALCEEHWREVAKRYDKARREEADCESA